MSTRPATVFVVDDEPAVRKALRLILQSANCRVETFASATNFLADYDLSWNGCLVSDVRMPGIDGLQLLQRLREEGSQLPVLMLSAHGDIPMAVRALQMGARDFLEKPVDPHILREKVAVALREHLAWRQQAEECEEITELLTQLTARERQVLELLVDGKHAKSIATALGTSHNTVRVQRANVMKKMRADTVGDLIRMMHRVGLLGED